MNVNVEWWMMNMNVNVEWWMMNMNVNVEWWMMNMNVNVEWWMMNMNVRVEWWMMNMNVNVEWWMMNMNVNVEWWMMNMNVNVEWWMMKMMISRILRQCRRHRALRMFQLRPDVKNNVHYAEEPWEKMKRLGSYVAFTVKTQKSLISLVQWTQNGKRYPVLGKP